MRETDVEGIWRMITVLWTVGSGAFGLCIAGFFYLLKHKDAYEKKLNDQLDEGLDLLYEIKSFLTGTLDKKGLISKVDENTRAIKALNDHAGH